MWRRRRLQKRHVSKWGKIFWIIPVFPIIIFIYFFFKLGIFTIRQVIVETKQLGCANGNQIRNSTNLLGQNFFLINSKGTEDTIKRKFYCIKSASVNKIFPDKVKIEALSRQPAALLIVLKEKEASVSSLIDIATPSARQVQGSYQVDKEGVIFSKDTEALNIPKVYIFDAGIELGKQMEGKLISNALRALEKVKQVGLVVKESWVLDKYFIVNSEVLNLRIIFRLNEKLDLQLASLQVILDKAKIDLKELEFIDLRFDKPIVKFAPEK